MEASVDGGIELDHRPDPTMRRFGAAAQLGEATDLLFKSWPEQPFESTQDVANADFNLLQGDFLLPAMVLQAKAVLHNIRLMSRFCERAGVSLAPHGKTYMSPEIFRLQAAAGAWGITVATVSQARVYRHFGAERVLLANQLIDAASIDWVLGQLRSDPSFEFYCLVDSVAGAEILEAAARSAGLERRVQVLIELGRPGGRTGCRDVSGALEVAEEVSAMRHLEIAGVEGFEGLIHGRTEFETLSMVDEFLSQVRALVIQLDRRGSFDHRTEIIVSAGGSAYFDRVVTQLTDVAASMPTRTVIRPGCYVTHDVGMYEETSPMAARAGASDERLLSAFELWSVILSRPEPELAIAGFGKRDAAYDYRLPTPLRVSKRGGGEVVDVRGELQVTELNDQHAYVRTPATHELEAGDVLICGISHPCAAFDKWVLIPVVDEDYQVVGAVRTYF